MATAFETRSTSRMLTLGSVAFVVAILYFAREILLPFALAVLISFLLAPLVTRLQRAGLGRVPAVVLVVTLALGVTVVTGFIVVRQLLDLTANLENYKTELVKKANAFRGDDGPIDRVRRTIEELQKEISEEVPEGEAIPKEEAEVAVEPETPAEPLVTPEGREPVPVRVVTPVEVTAAQPTPLQFLRDWLGPLLMPLGTAGLVTVFVVFMLVQREDLRNRLIRLIGETKIQSTTEALDDAAHRVSRYLLMQLIVNVTYGAAVALGLFVIGVPNYLLWGMLATLLRFIPYVGPWIAALTPILLSLAVFTGWVKPLMVVGLFVVLELASNNIMEPLLYGSSTGVSAVGIIASAVFWTWLWGGPGLVLATPLTVCLTVLGRRIPQLHFLNILLSDEPALTVEGRIYQRLLALDDDEAENLVDEYLTDHNRLELYDDVILPTLRMAEQDRHRGRLTDRQQEFLYRVVRNLIEEAAPGSTPAEKDALAVQARESENAPRILCLPGRDEADELSAIMLARVLEERGYEAQAIADEVLAAEQVELVMRENVPVVVVSSLPPSAAMHARYRCKRLRPARPDLKIVVGLWTVERVHRGTHEKLIESGADDVVTTLADAINDVRRHMAPLLVGRAQLTA